MPSALYRTQRRRVGTAYLRELRNYCGGDDHLLIGNRVGCLVNPGEATDKPRVHFSEEMMTLRATAVQIFREQFIGRGIDDRVPFTMLVRDKHSFRSRGVREPVGRIDWPSSRDCFEAGHVYDGNFVVASRRSVDPTILRDCNDVMYPAESVEVGNYLASLREEGVGRGGAHLESATKQTGISPVFRSARCLYVCVTQTEIKRLPTDQDSSCASSGGACIVAANHRTEAEASRQNIFARSIFR